MKLFVAGISYKTTPVEVREQLAIMPSKLVCYGCRLKICGDLDEVVLLSTCNRVEIYGTTRLMTGRIDSLFRLLTTSTRDFRPEVYVHEDTEAARHLFRVAGGRAIRFDDCLSAIGHADIVVSSTGCPKTILFKRDVETLMRARRNRPLFLIDIAVPRDIGPDVQDLDNVYLYNIDDLEAIVRENVRARQQDLAACGGIIERHAAALMAKLDLEGEAPAEPRYRAARREARPPENMERIHDAHIQPQPDWVFHGAAVCGS